MTQVYDMCTLVGQLAQSTLGNASSNNEPPQRLQELPQIIEWVEQLKIDFQAEHQAVFQLQGEMNRLRSMPLREELLTAIDLAIQAHMKDLSIDIPLGAELLRRTMEVVDNHLMILIKENDDIRNYNSNLLLEIDCLSQRLQPLQMTSPSQAKQQQALISNQKKSQPEDQLKRQNEYLNNRLNEVTELLRNSNTRIMDLEAKLLGGNIPIQTTERVSQLNSRQKQMLSQMALLEQENQNLKLKKNQIDQMHEAKKELSQKMAQMTKTIQNLTSKNSQLQSQIQTLKQGKNETRNQNAEELAKELVANKKKMEQMMNRVASYQNKVIDLELEKEHLTFQLNTLKTNFEEFKAQRPRASKISESGKLAESGRMLESMKCPDLVAQRSSTKMMAQLDELALQSPANSRKGKQRIFGEDSKIKRGSQVSEGSPKVEPQKPNKAIY